MIKKILTYRNLRQNVYEAVRNFVVSPEVPPGGKINEDELANKLGVSKTPVREALSKLAHDGIVEIIPNRGAYKVKLTKEDLREIMLIRETLEGLCVRLAVENINEKVIQRLNAILNQFEEKYLEKDFSRYPEAHLKFHNLLHNTSKSQRLIRIIQSMYDLINMVRLQYFSNPDNIKRSLRFHKELVDALEKRDGELAEKIRTDMLRSTYQYLLELV